MSSGRAARSCLAGSLLQIASADTPALIAVTRQEHGEVSSFAECNKAAASNRNFVTQTGCREFCFWNVPFGYQIHDGIEKSGNLATSHLTVLVFDDPFCRGGGVYVGKVEDLKVGEQRERQIRQDIHTANTNAGKYGSS